MCSDHFTGSLQCVYEFRFEELCTNKRDRNNGVSKKEKKVWLTNENSFANLDPSKSQFLVSESHISFLESDFFFLRHAGVGGSR